MTWRDGGTSGRVIKRRLDQCWSGMMWAVLVLPLVNQKSRQPPQSPFTSLAVSSHTVKPSIVYLSSISSPYSVKEVLWLLLSYHPVLY